MGNAGAAPKETADHQNRSPESTLGSALHSSMQQASALFYEEVSSFFKDSKAASNQKSDTNSSGSGGLTADDSSKGASDGALVTRGPGGKIDSLSIPDGFSKTINGDGTSIEKINGDVTRVISASGTKKTFDLTGGTMRERQSDAPSFKELNPGNGMQGVLDNSEKNNTQLPDLTLLDGNEKISLGGKALPKEGDAKAKPVSRPEHRPQGRLGDRHIGGEDSVPTEEAQSIALDVLEQTAITDMLGADPLAVSAAADIIGGDFESLGATLKELEGRGPEGRREFEKMAEQLGNLLGTDATAVIDKNNHFQLALTTSYSPSLPPRYLVTGSQETRLAISSNFENDGTGMSAWSSISENSSSSSRNLSGADVAAEARRIQSIATREVGALPALLAQMNRDN